MKIEQPRRNIKNYATVDTNEQKNMDFNRVCRLGDLKDILPSADEIMRLEN